MVAKVELGQCVITPGAQESVPEVEVMRALKRHVEGDWGNVGEEDAASNNQALKCGARVISSYESSDGTSFWIITEADRSSTTVLLPSEY